jgi:hypothetical protein
VDREGGERGKRRILEVVFVRFVVDKQRIADVEVRQLYGWLLRPKAQSEEMCGKESRLSNTVLGSVL